ncbi:MAG: hypothetical protein KIS95_04920 [Anaerolineae bacterium]|uniref:hypothetical protein n=1 Tax=Promineifilum sp. TaxID=2664178 RepID=UPI001E03F0D7|nr:hypothetical protein [Anaerolineales bacterium]MCB8935344.1 hypothetical protein [Promineifilum sp.]MCO5182114.1 hypothetical protein [Promineifilum sp.]MCW5846549.1 hypothetical protein [Anaerolineae bacterium]
MKQSTSPSESDRTRIQSLIDLELSSGLAPYDRLLLAILRQAIIDYFDDDPTEQLSAALYFAQSPFYCAVLQRFNLPEDTLPLGVDLTDFRRKEQMIRDSEPERLGLETLVRRLSGTQLKIVLTMGLLPQPVVTRRISLRCEISRSTTLVALEHLASQGLVIRHEIDGRAAWAFPAAVERLIQSVWAEQDE